MAARYGLVARHRAAPQRAVLRPGFRIREETFDQTLCYLPGENRKPWIDVDQGVGRGKSFPGCGGVAVAIDDPGLLGQKIAVQRKIFFVGDSLTALSELQLINDAKRQLRDLGYLPRQDRFSSPGVPEYGHAFHGAVQPHAKQRSSARRSQP